ncbi:LRR receptor-like serine/threonine-protein kinase [Pyrus ussuriensis x Pyrus communis]|uniref:LRR receptor-like serine/threonine-protein kinase n=1 Tax=Pyrus ussuriensis x Pyrus communis TaxID=2448454 RepID=A0A5N5HEU3_9ROSA|nr:LRR receptor-like serine/threonine-protein kinase [Pyrus ussuriensis x Pyrus communis]
MAKLVSNFHFLNRMKNCELPLMIVLFLFLCVLTFSFSKTLDIECVLDVQDSSAWHGTSSEAGNWGGFINSCCEQLSMITYTPWGTGHLFLNSTEQTNYLISMKGIKDDVLSCGIDKITSGAGGCSDYTKVDVFDNLRNTLEILDEGCNLLGRVKSGKRLYYQRKMRSHQNLKLICSFSVLVTLTSRRIDDKNWVSALHESLGDQRLSEASDDLLSEESGSLKISSKEIYSATGNPTGKVYKGILSNGKHVAVKHIINDGSVETFICEVTSLSDVRHPNLVALLGSCEGVEEYFLVYELSQNGDLSEWLFGKDKSLPWITRLELAIDSAGGLWLLQTYPRGCIVHHVIKPTNILIDKNFQVKLSDFELSKIMDLGQSYVSSEYRKNHHVNASGYVYSFGIVLPQLISGCRVINLSLNKPMPLKLADPKLNGEYSVEALDLAFNLALSCTGIKLQRSSMDQVVSKLEKALDTSTQKQSAFFTLPIKA